jgi:anti-sigma regulatory factor (Ser/Thr protein kinase)
MTDIQPQPGESRTPPGGRGTADPRAAIAGGLELPTAAARTKLERWIELEPRPDACARARSFIARIPEIAAPEQAHDAGLLVSELVANSVTHAGLYAHELILVQAIVRGGRLRVQVTDAGRGFFPKDRRRSSSSGWGLRLVGLLADRWGVLREAGMQVWFEMQIA